VARVVGAAVMAQEEQIGATSGLAPPTGSLFKALLDADLEQPLGWVELVYWIVVGSAGTPGVPRVAAWQCATVVITNDPGGQSLAPLAPSTNGPATDVPFRRLRIKTEPEDGGARLSRRKRRMQCRNARQGRSHNSPSWGPSCLHLQDTREMDGAGHAHAWPR